jgi:hypothetical protein
MEVRKMMKPNSGDFVNYKEYTNTSSASGVVISSAKSDCLASIIENKTIIFINPLAINIQKDADDLINGNNNM